MRTARISALLSSLLVATSAGAMPGAIVHLSKGGTRVASPKAPSRSLVRTPGGQMKTVAAPAKLQVQDLGILMTPGSVLDAKALKLKAGGTLEFSVPTNQINGIGAAKDFQVSPPGALVVNQTMLKPMILGRLGSTNLYRYAFSLAPGVKPGTTITVKTPGEYQSRNDPNFAATFSIVSE